MKTRILMTVAALLSMGVLHAQDASSGGCAPCSGDSACQAPCPPACCPEAQLNIETITVAAANGDPLAQYTLAYLTESGQGVPQDAGKARAMYAGALAGLQQSAQSGNPRACKALARMYGEGIGVDQDPAKAAEYMKMAKACKSARDGKGAMSPKDGKGCCKGKKACHHGQKHGQATPPACCTGAPAPDSSAAEVVEVVEAEGVTVVGEAPAPAPASPAGAPEGAPAGTDAAGAPAPSPEAEPAS